MRHNLILKKPLAVFDLETTGIDVANDRIVEICVAKANMDGSVEVKTRRINPTIPIPAEASAVHGIYDEDVVNEPTFKQIGKSMEQFLAGCDLAGFNSNKFDIPLLVEEFLRADIPFEMKNRKLIDVQRIYYMMEPRNLTAAFKFYCDKDLEGAHSAEADVLATLQVLDAQVHKYENTPMKNSEGETVYPIKNDMELLGKLSENNRIDFAGRMIYKDGVEVFNFGKYKGKPVEEVLKTDPGYYGWLLKGDFSLHTKKVMSEIRLRSINK